MFVSFLIRLPQDNLGLKYPAREERSQEQLKKLHEVAQRKQ